MQFIACGEPRMTCYTLLWSTRAVSTQVLKANLPLMHNVTGAYAETFAHPASHGLRAGPDRHSTFILEGSAPIVELEVLKPSRRCQQSPIARGYLNYRQATEDVSIKRIII